MQINHETKLVKSLNNDGLQANINTLTLKEQSQIIQQCFQRVMNHHLSFENGKVNQKQSCLKTEMPIELKIPPNTQSRFRYTLAFQNRIKKIMTAAYNCQELTLSEFNQFQQLFRLNQSQIKMVRCSDPVIIQTLRYAIFNKQQITQPLIKVIDRMSKTSLVKKWHSAIHVITKIVMFDLVCEIFEPPLDLYIQFIDNGLIFTTQQQLNEVLTQNQYLYKKQLYSTLSQKVRLIFNQFPYILDILNRIKNGSPQAFNFGGFRLYFNTILSFFKFPKEDCLLERYLPEVKCRYLRARGNLNATDIQYLFITLKSVGNLSYDNFKILYKTAYRENIIIREHKVKSWLKSWQVEQLCSQILTTSGFHLSQKQIEDFCQQLNFQDCFCSYLVRYQLIFVMLLQQSYNGIQFPESAFKHVIGIFKKIPDKKKRKQCCYILLLQYFIKLNQNAQKRDQIIFQLNFPEQLVNSILDQGRQIALDTLLQLDDINLSFNQIKYSSYALILKRVIKETKNIRIKNKCKELQKKLIGINSNNLSLNLSYCEKNITKDNQLIELLQTQVVKGMFIDEKSIVNIIMILSKNKNCQIKRSCLSTLRYVIKNHKQGQLFPQKFQRNILELIIYLYFYQKLSEQCYKQIVNLAIQLTNLTETYEDIKALMKFLFKIFMESSYDSFQDVNSSYGICIVALKLKERGKQHFPSAKKFLKQYVNQISKKISDSFVYCRGNVNVLCAAVAFGKNQIILSVDVALQLTFIALKWKNFTQIALMIVFYIIKYSKQEGNFQKTLMNVCQILRKTNNRQIMGVLILQNYFKKQKKLPNSVIGQLQNLTQLTKCQSQSCQRLCRFIKNIYIIGKKQQEL